LGTFELSDIPPARRGQPQIEVSFEIDSNGILNVVAQDKATSKREQLIITNDKGRLTQEEIDRMVKEAEDMAEEDKKTKERIDAKNAFDGYLHSMRSAIEGSGGLGDKLEADEKSTVMDAIKEGQSWMDSNPEADVDEIKQKEQEIKDICAPIMSKYYGQAGGGAGGDDSQDGGDEGEYDEL